jgi:hypothetical protein
MMTGTTLKRGVLLVPHVRVLYITCTVARVRVLLYCTVLEYCTEYVASRIHRIQSICLGLSTSTVLLRVRTKTAAVLLPKSICHKATKAAAVRVQSRVLLLYLCTVIHAGHNHYGLLYLGEEGWSTTKEP